MTEIVQPTTEGPDQARVPCPACSEPILPTAKVCRFCQRDVNLAYGAFGGRPQPGAGPTAGPGRGQAPPPMVLDEATTARGVSRGVLGAFAVVVAFAAVIVMAVGANNKSTTWDQLPEEGRALLTGTSSCAEKEAMAVRLRDEASGFFTSLAGDPDELNEVARDLEESADLNRSNEALVPGSAPGC